MANTKNYKLVKPGYTSSADINELNNNFDTIDKGLTLDVGSSTGTGNNYILDLGNITLSSDNKGLALRFFADKTANGNVVIVINNVNYSLLKTNWKNVKNLKSGSPYIIIFNGVGNFFLASGGGNEDETNVTASDVLLNKTFIRQDGEISTGTMPNNGSINANLGVNGTCIIQKGYTEGGKVTQSIPTKSAQTFTPRTYNQTIAGGQYLTDTQTILGDVNFIAKNIVNGVRIFDTVGTASAQNLLKYTSGRIAKDQTINFGFNILVVYIGDPNCFDIPSRTSSSFSTYINFNGILLQGGAASAYNSSGRIYVDYSRNITVSGTSMTNISYGSNHYYVIGY